MVLTEMQELTGNSSMNNRTESLGATGKVGSLKSAIKKGKEKIIAKKTTAKTDPAKSAPTDKSVDTSQDKPAVDTPTEESAKPSKKKILIISGIVIGVGIIGLILYKKFKK
jgi:hypothetical protein